MLRLIATTALAGSLAVHADAALFDGYEGPGSVFEFSQTGFSDGGVFSGAFIAEDLDGDGQIVGFGPDDEVFDLIATYESGLVSTSFDFGSLVAPVQGELTGLVYSLDGRGTIGDDGSRAVEGFALDNGDYYYASGPGPFQLCDGFSDCGFIAEFVEGDFGEEDDFDEIDDDFFTEFEQIVVADTSEIVQVTSGPIGNSGAGSTEDDPLLPDLTTPDGGFVFTVPEDVVPGQVLFIDPDIAIGYTYTVDGSTFASVVAPTFGAVPDPDGYELNFGATTLELLAGEEIFLPGGITEFSITGIDPSLGLDPTDQLAFVTGVTLGTITGTVTITQTPITAPIPLPASVLVLMSGLGGLGLLRRRGQRA